MVLRVIAAAFEDGWAFVETEGKVQLIRPPFRREDIVEVSEMTVDAAITSHGFSAVEATFANWRELIDHLWRRLKEEREGIGATGEKKDSAGELLRRAPLGIVKKFLEKVEHELFPRKEWQAAFSVLAHMMRNGHLKGDERLYEMVLDLFDRCREEMGGVAAQRRSLLERRWREIFPDAVTLGDENAIDEYVAAIVRRGQIMAVGGR